MNIKPIVYDTLTPRQRIIASVEALARKDDPELERLRDSCPQKHYKGADHRYTEPLRLVTVYALHTEKLLSEYVLSFLLAHNTNQDDLADRCFQGIINTRAAWEKLLEEMGIDPQSAFKMVKECRHPAVDIFLNYPAEELPEPEEEEVQKRIKDMKHLFEKFSV